MKTELCVETVKNAVKSYPELKGAILHSDRGSQYTSEKYREALKHAGFVQSMNSAGGRCHDNARCESMWARMKEELFYSRGRKSEDYTVSELKTMIWRYYRTTTGYARLTEGCRPLLKESNTMNCSFQPPDRAAPKMEQIINFEIRTQYRIKFKSKRITLSNYLIGSLFLQS